jgi:hypothetical protein
MIVGLMAVAQFDDTPVLAFEIVDAPLPTGVDAAGGAKGFDAGILGTSGRDGLLQITWDDLVPAAAPLEDPFPELSTDQFYALDTIVWVRAQRQAGLMSDVDPQAEEAVELSTQLKKEGLDVEALLKEWAEFESEFARRNEAVVADLEGRLVRIPGYALPLEFSGTAVREFLLVPYVGACIHVPPPPPNQIVLVTLERDFSTSELFTPVWVTGRINIELSEPALYLADGSADISVGYRMKDPQVEPYEQ